MKTNLLSRVLCTFTVGFLLCHFEAHSTNYYVDASFTGASGGTLANPWKDITSVNNNQWAFAGGDTIFFKKGQVYPGTLNIWTSGTASAPIVFMSYGAGAAPVFQYALPDASAVINRDIIVTSNNSYLVFDGFVLYDNTMNSTDHTLTANIGRGAYLYQSQHVTLKNLDISLVGIGITVQGDNNIVQNCTLHNLREIVNTASPAWDDYGAVGVLVAGSGNIIQSNTMTDCWATSSDYGFDGGAMELTGGASNNQVLYNTAVNNDGWMQIDTDGSTATESGNLVAYNLLINNGRVYWFNFGGTLTVQNFLFYNNDIIETALQHNNYPYMFGCDIAPANANALLMKNNIFWINTAIDITYTVTMPFSGAQMVHQNNLYHLSGGNLGYAINGTETMLAAGTAVFTSTANADPSLWDYHIPAGSPALDYGQFLGLTRDYAATAVASGAAPEAGILETVMSTLNPTVFSFDGFVKTGGNALQWQLKASAINHFDVERSETGASFRTIASVVPGNTPGNYNYLDKTGENLTCYYRIKAVFENNSISYSRIVCLEPALAIKELLLYPNPAVSMVTISSLGEDLYGKTLLLVSAAGQVVRQVNIKTHGNLVSLSLGGNTKGSYFIIIKNSVNHTLYRSLLSLH